MTMPCQCSRPGRFSIPQTLLFVFRIQARSKTTASSSRWLERQSRDPVAKDAKLSQLRARSAFKLMEINEKYKIFKKGQTVVDLGFAPGAWSQVAISNVGPRGRVLGIDILPATPPKGVSSMQANFLSRRTHNAIISYLSDPDRGRRISLSTPARKDDPEDAEALAAIEDALEPESYIDLEKRVLSADALQDQVGIHRDIEATRPKLVDVVLSDMFVPLPTSGAYHARQYLMAHYRMSNTTGLKAADHGASIDLCDCALLFCIDTLKRGGHFVCKVFNGSEAAGLKERMKKVFRQVHVMKPDSSRKESVEIYYIGMRKRPDIDRSSVTWESDDGEI